MRKKFKKLVGITTAVAMAVSLVPTNVFAEEPEVAVAEESAKNDNLLRVWYDEPATDWQTQSLAIGNGYMGSLVFGGINKDKIHINEKTVWEGGPTSYNGYSYGTTNKTETEADLQKIKDDLNAIREKLDDKSEYVFGFDEDSYEASGTNTKGEAMDWLNKLMGDLVGYSAPKDYANLYISNNQDSSKVSNYVRDLDMRTALATVNYDYEGVHYTREYFDSYPDNVMAVRLSADQKGKISFDTNLQSLIGGRTHKSTVDGDTITMRDALGGNGLNIEAQLKVINEGGNLSSNANGSNPSITVSDADAVTLIFACGTDYKMELPNFRGEDPHDAVTARINAAAKKGYEALKEDHVADHSALFSRMELGFNEEVPTIPTDELIKKIRKTTEVCAR
jgi:alpha-L-fucosidase 2